MDYPEHLIPRPDYRIMVDVSHLDGYCLQRSTPGTDIIDPDTSKIKAKYVAFQRDHLRDLSTNLISVFQPEDRYWGVTGERKAYYVELWQEGETVAQPTPEESTRDEQKGAIYFSIQELLAMEVPYEKGDEEGVRLVQCKVLHTPVRSNFWHFSIRWFNEDGEIMNQKGKWSKRMLTTARSMLIEIGRMAPTSPKTLPQALYSRAAP